MPRPPAHSRQMSPKSRTRRGIVKLLKSEGAMGSAELATRLHVTPMAVRQHLYVLQREKLVSAEERAVPLGRPAKYWRLTREADRLFPDAYAELSVALIDAVGDTFGAAGMERLLEARLAKQLVEYSARIDPRAALGTRLQQLARRIDRLDLSLQRVAALLGRPAARDRGQKAQR